VETLDLPAGVNLGRKDDGPCPKNFHTRRHHPRGKGRGAFAAGAQSVRIEVGTEGQIIVIAGKSGTVPTDANASETSEDVKKLL
jgi:hypothetical protein